MSYSRKKGESCPSHTKKCVTIEFEPQNREKGVCTAQNRGESTNFHQFLPKLTHQASFLPNHVPDITTVGLSFDPGQVVWALWIIFHPSWQLFIDLG